ncbi:MAG: hypothetical protein K940chlam3_01510 [Chlamydiae bacterium]|nr:hypothetical protein [Chlamydiota bacterium]
MNISNNQAFEFYTTGNQGVRVDLVKINDMDIQPDQISPELREQLSKILQEVFSDTSLDKRLTEISIQAESKGIIYHIESGPMATVGQIDDPNLAKRFMKIRQKALKSRPSKDWRMTRKWSDRSHVKTLLMDSVGNLFKGAFYQLFGREDEENKIPLIHDEYSLKGPHTIRDDPGKHIKQEYKIAGVSYGTESIDRMDTLALHRKILENELNKLMQQEPFDEDQIKKVIQEIDKLNDYEMSRLALGKPTTWVRSQDFREECRRSSYENACHSVPLGAPVNLRMQKMTNSEGEVLSQLARLGAITNPGMGWFSLEELEEIRSEFRDSGTSDRLYKLTRTMERFFEDPPPSSILETMKLKVLGTKPKLRGERLNSALKAQLLLYTIKNKAIDQKDFSLLDEMIEQQKTDMRRQMLQYVYTQVGHNMDKIDAEQAFNIFHVSLLNLHTRNLDSSGWMHDEKVAFRDFRRIMKEFDGKTLVFGKEGPLVDGDKIYLPFHAPGVEEGAEVKLNTFIFNISPQGDIYNDGLQLEHNNHEIGRLRNQFPDFFSEDSRSEKNVRNRLQGGKKTGYSIAEDFSEYLLQEANKRNGVIGLNCASGKDRTGFVAARLMLKILTPFLPDRFNPFLSKILRSDFPATQVVEDNLPNIKVLKIHPVTAIKEGIPGYSKIDTIRFLSKQIFSRVFSTIPV